MKWNSRKLEWSIIVQTRRAWGYLETEAYNLPLPSSNPSHIDIPHTWAHWSVVLQAVAPRQSWADTHTMELMKHEGTIIILVSRTQPCGWHIAMETSNLTYNPPPCQVALQSPLSAQQPLVAKISHCGKSQGVAHTEALCAFYGNSPTMETAIWRVSLMICCVYYCACLEPWHTYKHYCIDGEVHWICVCWLPYVYTVKTKLSF